MQVESRGNLFTMPRRCRFKPRKDCEAILGKLSLLVNPIILVFSLLVMGLAKLLFSQSPFSWRGPQSCSFCRRTINSAQINSYR